MTRKYFKTTITVEVLSDHPVEFDNLADVYEVITFGDCSGKFTSTTEEVDSSTMAKLLEAHGSDPELFDVTSEGEELHGEDC